MALEWKRCPDGGKHDHVAHGKAGTWHVRRANGRDMHYVVRLNGVLQCRLETKASAQAYAELKEQRA